jgi:ribosome-associated translation inhibitor RaiA
MQQFPTDRTFRVVFDVHQFRLPEAQEQLLRDRLDGLARQVEHFPVADLHVLIEGNARTNDVSVKLSLVLPGATLVTQELDGIPQPAFDRCLDSLIDSLQAYKERLGNVPEIQKTEKGTHQELHPAAPIDAGALAAAVDEADYAAFRTAMLPYEEGLSKLVGRWVQRYPGFEAEIGRRVKITDVVEEVFLMAFEGYKQRPRDISLGIWLQSLIDPAVQALQRRRDTELENIEMVRSALEAEQGPRSI